MGRGVVSKLTMSQKARLSVGAATLLFVNYVGLFPLELLFAILPPDFPISRADKDVLSTSLSTLLSALCFCWLAGIHTPPTFALAEGWETLFVVSLSLGILVSFDSVYPMVLEGSSSSGSANEGKFQTSLMLDGPSVLKTWVSFPFLEEYYFRGLLLSYLIGRSRAITAPIVFVSLVFAVLHVNPYFFPLQFLVSFLLSSVYVRTRSILVPITIHGLHNVVVTIEGFWPGFQLWDPSKSPWLAVVEIGLLTLMLKLVLDRLSLRSLAPSNDLHPPTR